MMVARIVYLNNVISSDNKYKGLELEKIIKFFSWWLPK